MKKIKSQRGITIVSLVATVVVLTIITGITIGTAVDDDGVIKTAEQTKENAEKAKEATQVRLNELYGATRDQKIVKDYNTDLDSFRTKISEALETRGVQTSADESADSMAQKILDLEGESTAPTLSGNAQAAQVLSGRTFYSDSGTKLTGTMPVLESENFIGTYSSKEPGATSNYTVTASKSGYVTSGTQVNSIAATTSPTISTTAGTGEETINIKPGFYNKIKVNRTATATSGMVGNATADKVLAGYTFTNSTASGINGTMVSGK